MGETLRVDQRSQQIMRVPRDKTPGELIMDDGERAYVLFFVPLGDTLSRVFEDPNPFLPVAIGNTARIVSRAAIACVSAHVMQKIADESDLPHEKQRAIIRLRGGTVIRGELRWVAQDGHRRTVDHLNDISTYLEVHDGDYIHFIAKAAVVSAEEF